jgi:hypothetical protein
VVNCLIDGFITDYDFVQTFIALFEHFSGTEHAIEILSDRKIRDIYEYSIDAVNYLSSSDPALFLVQRHKKIMGTKLPGQNRSISSKALFKAHM